MSTLTGIGLILIGLAILVSSVLQYAFAKRLAALQAEHELDHANHAASLEWARMCQAQRNNIDWLNAQARANRETLDHAQRLHDGDGEWK